MKPLFQSPFSCRKGLWVLVGLGVLAVSGTVGWRFFLKNSGGKQPAENGFFTKLPVVVPEGMELSPMGVARPKTIPKEEKSPLPENPIRSWDVGMQPEGMADLLRGFSGAGTYRSEFVRSEDFAPLLPVPPQMPAHIREMAASNEFSARHSLKRLYGNFTTPPNLSGLLYTPENLMTALAFELEGNALDDPKNLEKALTTALWLALEFAPQIAPELAMAELRSSALVPGRTDHQWEEMLARLALALAQTGRTEELEKLWLENADFRPPPARPVLQEIFAREKLVRKPVDNEASEKDKIWNFRRAVLLGDLEEMRTLWELIRLDDRIPDKREFSLLLKRMEEGLAPAPPGEFAGAGGKALKDPEKEAARLAKAREKWEAQREKAAAPRKGLQGVFARLEAGRNTMFFPLRERFAGKTDAEVAEAARDAFRTCGWFSARGVDVLLYLLEERGFSGGCVRPQEMIFAGIHAARIYGAARALPIFVWTQKAGCLTEETASANIRHDLFNAMESSLYAMRMVDGWDHHGQEQTRRLLKCKEALPPLLAMADLSLQMIEHPALKEEESFWKHRYQVLAAPGLISEKFGDPALAESYWRAILMDKTVLPEVRRRSREHLVLLYQREKQSGKVLPLLMGMLQDEESPGEISEALLALWKLSNATNDGVLWQKGKAEGQRALGRTFPGGRTISDRDRENMGRLMQLSLGEIFYYNGTTAITPPKGPKATKPGGEEQL